MTTPKKSHASEPAFARKNMDIDVRKLAAARKFLGASSDTETVDLALDDIVFHGEVSSALDRLAALGGLDDIYAEPEKKPRRVRKS
ncbi:MAG TPA: hypothetical protein VIJ90_07760 [Gemmatimonadaceae bacterium]|jgi:Arc/MetJ family transcription regulator